MKVIIATLRHETNTFSPVETPLASFFNRSATDFEETGVMLAGDAAISRFEHTRVPFAAYLDIVRERNVEFVVPLYANANPSAPTNRVAYDKMTQAILDEINDDCDAILLDLHGAMVAEGIDDAEGELLKRIRAKSPNVPIAVALDFHSNLSESFFRCADIVTGYCTYPHIDAYETGERAARTLFEWLDSDEKPELVYRRLPMLTHMNRQTPASEPMKSIMDRAIEAETTGEVHNASVFGGFPLADIPEAGLFVVTVAESITAAAELADELAAMAWDRREDFVFEPEPIETTIAHAKTLNEYPVILADHGNNCGAGGSVDTMAVYKEILHQGLENVIAGPVCDPMSVAEAISVGVGAKVSLAVGGKTDMPAIGQTGTPLEISGTVRCITDGRFTVTGPMFTGVEVNMGKTVVIDTGPMKIVISEYRVEPFDVGVYTHCGLDPQQANYVLLHSRQHFKAGFEPIARHILLVSGPGVCTSDYASLGFKRLTRPIFPLDPDAQWP